jgi:hypothetical protein
MIRGHGGLEGPQLQSDRNDWSTRVPLETTEPEALTGNHRASGAHSIIKVSRRTRAAGFEIVAHDIIRHPRLGHEAKSVIIDILSHTDQFLEDHHLVTADGYWAYASRTYEKHAGRNAYGRIFRELESEGFISRRVRRVTNQDGKAVFQWDISLHDQSSDSHDSPSAGFQPTDFQPTETQPIKSSIQRDHQENLDRTTGVLAEAIEQPDSRASFGLRPPGENSPALESTVADATAPSRLDSRTRTAPSEPTGSDQSWLDKYLPASQAPESDLEPDLEVTPERAAKRPDTRAFWYGLGRTGDPYWALCAKRGKIPSDQGRVELAYDESQTVFGSDTDARWKLYDWCLANGDEIGCRAVVTPRIIEDNRGNLVSKPRVDFINLHPMEGDVVIEVSHDEKAEYLRLMSIGHAGAETGSGKSGMDLANEMATRWLRDVE